MTSAIGVTRKNGGETEFARFQYYDGKNPGWPEKILAAEYGWALEAYDRMRLDSRSVEEINRVKHATAECNPHKGAHAGNNGCAAIGL